MRAATQRTATVSANAATCETSFRNGLTSFVSSSSSKTNARTARPKLVTTFGSKPSNRSDDDDDVDGLSASNTYSIKFRTVSASFLCSVSVDHPAARGNDVNSSVPPRVDPAPTSCA